MHKQHKKHNFFFGSKIGFVGWFRLLEFLVLVVAIMMHTHTHKSQIRWFGFFSRITKHTFLPSIRMCHMDSQRRKKNSFKWKEEKKKPKEEEAIKWIPPHTHTHASIQIEFIIIYILQCSTHTYSIVPSRRWISKQISDKWKSIHINFDYFCV